MATPFQERSPCQTASYPTVRRASAGKAPCSALSSWRLTTSGSALANQPKRLSSRLLMLLMLKVATFTKFLSAPVPVGPSDHHLCEDTATARPSRSGDFIRMQYSSKVAKRGLFQQRSSTVSKTGTSSRRVARVRYNRASLHEVNSDSESERAFRMVGCHSRQSLGMPSR